MKQFNFKLKATVFGEVKVKANNIQEATELCNNGIVLEIGRPEIIEPSEKRSSNVTDCRIKGAVIMNFEPINDE